MSIGRTAHSFAITEAWKRMPNPLDDDDDDDVRDPDDAARFMVSS